MTAIVQQDERGRWQVKYHDGTFVGTYVALGKQDADDFAASEERQQADRAFAVRQFQIKHGRKPA